MKITAKYYGTWGDIKFYKTEDGRVYSSEMINGVRKIFRFGNVTYHVQEKEHILSETETKELVLIDRGR